MSCSESDMISKTWPVSFLQLTDLSISLVTKDIAVRVVGRSLAFLGRSLTAKLLIHVHGGQIVKLTKEQQLRWDITIDVMRSIETQFLAVSVKAGRRNRKPRRSSGKGWDPHVWSHFPSLHPPTVTSVDRPADSGVHSI